MTEAPANPTVLDATVVSNFAHVDEVERLADLPRVVTVPVVRAELVDGAETHGYLERAIGAMDEGIPVVTMTDPMQDAERSRLKRLDPGEAQAMAVAETLDGTLVTDDGDARRVANDDEVPVTGSIGLLVRFVERDQLRRDTADTYLKRWIDEGGFRSPARDIETFLEE